MKKPLALLCSLTILGSMSAQAQDVRAVAPLNGKMLVASNVVKLQSPAQVASIEAIPSAPKKFLVPFYGTVRVKWQVKSATAGRSASVTVGSTLDNCTTGAGLSTTSVALVPGTCDLRVLPGDIVRVSVTGTMTTVFPTIVPGSNGIIRNVQVFYNVVNGDGLGKVLP